MEKIKFETSIDEFKQCIEEQKLLIVGEIHGVIENYLVYKYLIEFFDIKKVCLEVNAKHIDKYVSLYKEDDWVFNGGDGRLNKYLFNFIDECKNKNIEISYFDNYNGSFNDPEYPKLRDLTMCNNIYENLDNNITLIIAGNYHTMRNRENSMAWFMSKKKKFISVKLNYLSGSYYNLDRMYFPTSTECKHDQNCLLYKDHNINYDYVIDIPNANSVI